MSLVPFRKNTKVGFCLPNKEIVIEPQFDEALPFQDGFAWVKLDGIWGLIKQDGSFHLKPKYDFIDEYIIPFNSSGRLLRIAVKDKWGILIDNFEVIPPIYDFAPLKVCPMVYLVVKNKKIAYVNDQNEIIIPFDQNSIFNTPNSYNEKVKWFQKENFIWNIYSKKTVKINSIFDGFEREIEETNTFLCYKQLENKRLYGIQDIAGQVIFGPTLDGVSNEIEGYIIICINNLLGLFTLDFQEIFTIKYHSLMHFKDDIFIVNINQQCEFLNRNKEQILLDFIPKTAIVTQVYTTNKYIEFIDNGTFNYCDYEGNVYFTIALSEIQDRFVSDNYVVVNSFYPYYSLLAKTKTYILDQENHNYIALDFSVSFIQIFDNTFANIRGMDESEFVYNLKTGKKEYLYKISQRKENFYLISDKDENTGAMDKLGNITVPIENKKVGRSNLNFGNYKQFFIQLHNKTYEDDAFGFPYWVDVINNIVYAEDLPIIEAVDIQSIIGYKKINIGIPTEHHLHEFLKNIPTNRWSKSMRAGDNIFTKNIIKDSKIILNAFIDKLYKSPHKKLETVRQLLLDIQNVQRKHGSFIDTLEREELYVFIRDASEIETFDKVFEEFRSF